MIEGAFFAVVALGAVLATAIVRSGQKRARADAALRAFCGVDSAVTAAQGRVWTQRGDAMLFVQVDRARPVVGLLLPDARLDSARPGDPVALPPADPRDGLLAAEDVIVGPAELSAPLAGRYAPLSIPASHVAYLARLATPFSALDGAAIDEVVTAGLTMISLVREDQGLPPLRWRCPRCRWLPMSSDAGQLGEAVCVSCRGRHLPLEVAEAVFADGLGLTPGDLKAKMGDYAQMSCAQCRGDMHALVLEDVVVDVCKGCGAAFFDAHELERVSGGRFAG